VKVLLLDDAALTRVRLAAVFAAVDGVEVTARETCRADTEAIIQAQRPDVVVVDVHAPRAMGLDLIRKLRCAAWRPVVIAVSSASSLQYRLMCHEAGAAYYFDKVREQDRLVEAIGELRRELT
jgi:two-component system response regulator DevR